MHVDVLRILPESFKGKSMSLLIVNWLLGRYIDIYEELATTLPKTQEATQIINCFSDSSW